MFPVFGLLHILLLVPQVTDSQLVSCYTQFDTDTGACLGLIGNVTQDACCLNYYYGFRKENGDCMSCRQASWSAWMPWGPCSVSCLRGVKQRQRRCDGIGECKDPEKHSDLQITVCEDRDCCPEQGGLGEWGQWQPCSVTCGDGTARRERPCSSPPPKCGGGCDGAAQETKPCATGVVCPTHGSWSQWAPWGPCSGTCRKEGAMPPSRQRQRTCTNPSPSSTPAGRPCQGADTETLHCDTLRLCPIDGAWGPWGPLSECSVTCGVGQRLKTRICNNPAPKHGGRNCDGDSKASEICNTQIKCPVHGEWEEWGEWATCAKSTYGRTISCTKKTGTQSRRRNCFHDFGGRLCEGSIVEHRNCYDITHTPAKGDQKEITCEKPSHWDEWSQWGFCVPFRGALRRVRERKCVPTLPEFVETAYGRVYYSGKPKLSCPAMANLNDRKQMEDCPA